MYDACMYVCTLIHPYRYSTTYHWFHRPLRICESRHFSALLSYSQRWWNTIFWYDCMSIVNTLIELAMPYHTIPYHADERGCITALLWCIIADLTHCLPRSKLACQRWSVRMFMSACMCRHSPSCFHALFMSQVSSWLPISIHLLSTPLRHNTLPDYMLLCCKAFNHFYFTHPLY